MSSELEFDLDAAVKAALPSIEEHVLKDVTNRLVECGVQNNTDLTYVCEADLSEVLRPIPARRLLAFWKGKLKCAFPCSLHFNKM